MYGVIGEKRPISVESDAFLYNLGDPTIVTFRMIHSMYNSLRGSPQSVWPCQYDYIVRFLCELLYIYCVF